jgi:hypothetical protein
MDEDLEVEVGEILWIGDLCSTQDVQRGDLSSQFGRLLMNTINIGSLRAPVDILVRNKWPYESGRFILMWQPEDDTENPFLGILPFRNEPST